MIQLKKDNLIEFNNSLLTLSILTSVVVFLLVFSIITYQENIQLKEKVKNIEVFDASKLKILKGWELSYYKVFNSHYINIEKNNIRFSFKDEDYNALVNTANQTMKKYNDLSEKVRVNKY